ALVRSAGASRDEEVSPLALDVVGGTEGDGLDGRGRVDGRGGDEDAAVDQEEVGDVPGPAVAVDDRGVRLVAHAAGAEQVPAGGTQGVERDGRGRAGGLEGGAGAGDAVDEHAPGVVAQPVADQRRRQAG